MAKDSEITGDVHANGAAALSSGVLIDGDLSAAGQIALHGATVTGAVTPLSPAQPLPSLPSAAAARALADRVFEGNRSFPSGTVIDDLVFVSGQARFLGSVNGTGTVIAGGQIRFDNASPGQPAVLEPGTRMSFVSLGSLWVGKDRELRGELVAAGAAQLHKGLELTGLIAVRGSLAVHKEAVITYSPPVGEEGDTEPPQLAFTAPGPVVIGDPMPTLGLAFSDTGSGVDAGSLSVVLDGAELTAACTVDGEAASCPTPELTAGSHSAEAMIADLAGNPATATLTFDIVLDLEPPMVTIVTPADGTLVNTTATRVTGTVSDDSGLLAAVAVNGRVAALTGDRFDVYADLGEGANELVAVATDAAGRQATAVAVVTLDSQLPTLVVTTPVSGQLTNHDTVRVAGRAEDANGVAELLVQGSPVALSGGAFEHDVPLAEGANQLTVRVVDAAGNAQQATLEVTRFTLPVVSIASPADLSTVVATTVDVHGTVSGGAAVAVNGIAAAVAGNEFVAADVPLVEGGNILTATATGAGGRVGSDSVNVVRDLTPPRVVVHYPRAGATLFEPAVTVSGMVNDLVTGTVNATQATVTVNGRTATVANRSFEVADVPLTAGANVLDVRAEDASGNVGQTEVVVHLEAATVPRVVLVSGDRQSGVIGTPLPQPLVVALLDAAGQPVVGRPVVFKVRGNDGSLDPGRRQVAVTTDAAGRAAVTFTLGTRAGAGNQAVEAAALGFRGPAVFTATALPGPPALIVVDAGDQQVGIAGQELPRPLVATVTDYGFNRLEGAAVTFRVTLGEGLLAGGDQSLSVATDSDGRAIANLVLDPAEGIAGNVVEATIDALEDGPKATFTASGLGARDQAATSISGVVLDNSNVPVPGVTLRFRESARTAQTDARGVFRIPAAPVGTVHLIVDGSTATVPGAWPDLEFVLTTIPGRDVDLGMPIYLLPLELGQGLFVDETHGGTLTLAEVPGFALEVQPGSVTFPGGSRSGLVSVTAVHGDKVPMVPNFGQQPRFIVTIQPAGARFEPPARLTLPNLEGLAPGRVTEFYSFDHDLGSFVSIGPATVAEDGTVITSNSGVGIVKAGWHCGGDPAAAGTAADCPSCQICNGSTCVPGCALPANSTAAPSASEEELLRSIFAAQCTCDDQNECTINDRCDGSGGCTGDPVEVRKIDGVCVGALNQAVPLTADSNAPDRVTWTAPGGNPASGMGGSFSVTYAAKGDKTVTAACRASSKTQRVTIDDPCAGITPSLQEPEVAGSTGGNFGQVVPGTRRVAKYKGCVEGMKWCFRLEEYLEEHSFAVRATDANDISGAADPKINAGNCVQVIGDLTPPSVGTAHGPPRGTWWSSAVTTAHERFHVARIHTDITLKVYADLQTFVQKASNCTDCKSATPTARFDAEMNRLFSLYDAIELRDSERLAHNHSNAMYRAMITQIRQRALNEGWPNACR